MAELIPLDKVKWDPAVYPRAKPNTGTITRYADALDAGDTFPPVVLEAKTDILLDGKHRLEAHRKADRAEILAEWRSVPKGMSKRYFAATLSARHGDRMSNADLEKLAVECFEADPGLNMAEWGRPLSVSSSTMERWVGHITRRGRSVRSTKAWRLTKLGWTQAEAGERLGVDQRTISLDTKDSHLGNLGEILGSNWGDKLLAQEADRLDLPMTEAWAAAIDGLDDADRMKRLGIKKQPYDVWFPWGSCHDLMGDKHPGRIPGELLCHVLYFFTKPGDLVVDPMAGSGTTLDACLLMGRHARGYDIDERHERVDIEHHDLSTGWPDTVRKASLVFWDPPYFDKMDHSTIGADGYVEGSISGLDPDEYIGWIAERLTELHKLVQPGTRLLFLMSDWDSENAKRHAGHAGLFVWDYADILREAGWSLRRQIQVPLSTQQVHPDIVNKFWEGRRLARLGRSLLVAEP